MAKVQIEGSTENLPVKPTERHFSLTGLEDLGRSIIPVPFYKFVQPSSEKVFLPDGKRAPNGTFLMQDVRQAVESLRIVILRAKRATRIENNELNQPEKVVSLQVLGINIERQKPFILSVPLTSFAAFGAVFEDLESRNASNAWDFPVTLEAVEVNRPKETASGLRNVNYWVIKATLGSEPLSPKDNSIAAEAYQDFAGKLDRENDDEDELAAIAGK